MKFLMLLYVLLDIAQDPPFTYGATGKGVGVAFGLFLSAMAIAVFLLFRKRLPTSIRGIVAAVLLLFGIGGAAVIWAAFACYDAEAIRNRPIYQRVRPPHEEEEGINEEAAKPQTNANVLENKRQKADSNK